jgi:cold shock protein
MPRCLVRGRVKRFDNSKGYGFIERSDGPDVFVHYTAIVGEGYRTLDEGDFVEFEVVQGPKGPQADNVVRIPGESADRYAVKKGFRGHSRH